MGDNGAVIASSDGGRTWLRQVAPLQGRLACVSFATPLVGWISGEGGGAARTVDGGSTWRAVTVIADDLGLGPPDTLSIVATGANTAWACARWEDATFLYRTTDGGDSWRTVRYTDRGYNSPGAIFGMAFVSDAEGWLVAARITGPPQTYTPVFLRTADAGARWEARDAYATHLNHPSTPRWSVRLAAASGTDVLVHFWDGGRQVGALFHMLKGPRELWRQAVRPLDVPLGSVSFPDVQNAWLVGEDTRQSVDYAHSYRRVENPGAEFLAAAFTEAGGGVAVGAGGQVFRWEPDAKGDLNGDGVVDIADAVMAGAVLSGAFTPDVVTRRLADLHPSPDGDGEITVADVTAILAVAGGLHPAP